MLIVWSGVTWFFRSVCESSLQKYWIAAENVSLAFWSYILLSQLVEYTFYYYMQNIRGFS